MADAGFDGGSGLALTRRVIRFFASVGLGGFLVAAASAAEIRVVTWNAEWFPGQKFQGATPPEERAHIAAAREVVDGLKADVFLGQELRDWKSFDRLADAEPGLKVANVSHFPDRDTGGLWRQQIGIASKLPVVASWAEPWRSTLGALTRGFSFAAIDSPGGRNEVILFYALHLKSNRARSEQDTETNYRVRNESIAQVLEHVDLMERLMWKGRVAGVVVGGDFNTNHDGQFADRVVELMVEAGFANTWAEVPRDRRLSWRGSDQYEATTFDYVFAKGPRLSFGDAYMVEVPEGASDHHAVGLVIEVD